MNDVKIGTIVKGQVTGITLYGVFVTLNDDYTGMVHISEVSNKFIKNLNKNFKIGDIISVKVIDIDENKRQVKLSIKDIDYKVEPDASAIKEKGTGFEVIKKNFDKWVETKMKEIDEK